ncbi:putative ATPase [Mycobacterium sp. BK086]|nr:BTAD domain-containing putative transcriptional regulator [Mycobacterium sp. BK086]TDO14340.1 putative ATPase [Mycobacterium sp. BK086]
MELGVLGPLQVRQFGLPVAIPGAKPRAILTMLGLYGGAVVPGDALVELLWGTDPPRTAAKALQTHISALRRVLGDGFVLTQGAGWTLSTAEIDAIGYTTLAGLGREAMAAGDARLAATHFDAALKLWRGAPELPDGRRGGTERTRWVEGHAALVEDRADALLATGRAAELIGELEAAIADAPLRERRWAQLMLALYRAGRQGEALAAYQRVRRLLAEELGVDPGPELRRLDSKIVAQDISLELPAGQHFSAVMRAVTFLLTDIEGSTAAWEVDAEAMGAALARHDEIVEQVVTFGGGRLIKTRGEGDATFSVFDRPSSAAAAAVELQEAIRREPWPLAEPMRIRIALHTGEVEFRDGDYFGRAVNRAARLRSLATGGQTLCSGATAELVIDSLADDVVLADLGMRQLKNLTRPEHVFELRLQHGEDPGVPAETAPLDRPALPAVLTGPGPFVGRTSELEGLLAAWQATLTAGTHAVLIAGEPGVGKTRLAGEWSYQAHSQGAVVVYGRCDEDLGAPYQPFAEAMRTLVPCLGADRLRGLRGVESLLPLVPALTDVLPDLAAAPRAAPDAERYALFDAVVALLGVASASAPLVLVLDDLHWAAKPTLLLLRHLLRFGEQARVQIVGTYRSTDLDRSHPLAAMLADLHRDGSATRLALGGLDENDVTAYVAEAGYADEELARALASVTGGNPFFLIEALHHVEESGGRWDPNSLPQGIREAVSRRLSRLPTESNTALAAAAVVGSRFAVDLVEKVVERDLVDAFDQAGKAGIVIEEPGGRYRFNHALVRQSLLAELPSVRRMRLHQKIGAALESELGDADDDRLDELAYHYFECAWAGNAAKAVEYCRRAADQAMARLGYEGAADLYDKALHALEELDDERPDRDDLQAELLVARCEALLAAGDVVSAGGAVTQLRSTAGNSPRLSAWGTCFDGQLAMLTDPGRLDAMESAVGAAALALAALQDPAGEAKAHTVRAGCLARLGRIGDCETALDQALTAARRAREHRRVNAVLAGAPLAALWGPNPVPRAGGRCLDVVRLLRITTGSPVVEATSTRCQGVLDALRGRAAAGRQLIDSARRTLSELGMRHAVLEVEQFAGIIELVADDATAAERHLRKAYNGFRRMGLDADTAETAALLARACLALDRDVEADELCTESERLAGHAFKAAIAWRTVRAQLLARAGEHDEARRVAGEAVAIAERTDALVDHGDACLALASVLGAAGDTVGARAAAERALALYELKGAAALSEKARRLLAGRPAPAGHTATEVATAAPDNECFRVGRRLVDAVERQAWDEVEHLLADEIDFESRRMIVGVAPLKRSRDQWREEMGHYVALGITRYPQTLVAARGDRLALVNLSTRTDDASLGAPQDEFLQLAGIDSDGRICLQLWFDVEDLDAAIIELDALNTRFEQESRSAHPVQPDTACVRVGERALDAIGREAWDEFEQLFARMVFVESRRKIVRFTQRDIPSGEWGQENRRLVEAGNVHASQVVVAVRGERLVLTRFALRPDDVSPGAPHDEMLQIYGLDDEGHIALQMWFDIDDLDSAIAELDARYLAGEAAEHADTWSVVVGAFAAFNQRAFPATTPDWINIDHRDLMTIEESGLSSYAEGIRDLAPDVRVHIESVHRLTDLGAVVTYAARGTSKQGFDAEWREVALSTVTGDLIDRCEIFRLDDLAAALAKFDELSCPATQLANAASRTYERWLQTYGTRDWAAMADVVADDIVHDDRRRVVNGGIQRGPEAVIGNMRAIAEVGVRNIDPFVIATRGDRLALARQRVSGDKRPDAFGSDVLIVIEVDADNRFAFGVAFDPDDRDAAFAELDARFGAGEAAAHAAAWSVVAENVAAVISPELPSGTTDMSIYIEAVHRLDERGTVFAYAATETADQAFRAERRGICLSIVDGDLISRSERFDEADLDAALARFEELTVLRTPHANAAARIFQRYNACFMVRDWDGMAALISDDICADDRRRVVSGGVQRGRLAQTASMRAAADMGVRNAESWVVATRGDRLALMRTRVSGHQRNDAFGLEMLSVFEIDTKGLGVAGVLFDLDDIDAALAELDARYLAGEAAPYADMWSRHVRAYAAVNRHELPEESQDWLNSDHRKSVTFATDDMAAYVQATFDEVPNLRLYIEAVHRLNSLGSVVTHVMTGTSRHGFDAEWREVVVATVDGEQIIHSELFDEADLEAALARFENLGAPTHLENQATRVTKRFRTAFAARDWDAMAGLVADDLYNEDRRRVVNAGIRHGRDSMLADLRAAAEIGVRSLETIDIATRGQRLVLARATARYSGTPGAFRVDNLVIAELDTDGRTATQLIFDPDDIDAAFAELDARYMTGEAAAHAQIWSLVTQTYAAFNRHELSKTTPDWVNIDHRLGVGSAPGQMNPYVTAMWAVAPDVTTRIEAVHRLSNLGAVFTHTERGTSEGGFDAEWREVALLTFDGDAINRCELFDEADLDDALARFDELDRRLPLPENAASRLGALLVAHYAARDWGAVAAMLACNTRFDDRRSVVNAGSARGRDIVVEQLRLTADAGTANAFAACIATRGDRLALGRFRYSSGDSQGEPFFSEFLAIAETDCDDLIVARIVFDLEDIDAAFAELESRYLAGEAAPYENTWAVLVENNRTINRHELPAWTPDVVNIDHRRVTPFAAGDLPAFLRASWETAPDVQFSIEAVHRLSRGGAVFTHTACGSSPAGFHSEWRGITVAMVDGDCVCRSEHFDETDLAAALARFDELDPADGASAS